MYVDGTFLAGPNKGTLLVAVSQDSCDQLVLIAVAVVESENTSSWNWFMGQIGQIININDPNVVIMSDREKGIINAVDTIAPLCSKAFCVRHIYKNLRTISRDKIAMNIFWRALATYSVTEFNEEMSLLETQNPRIHQSLVRIGTDKWANSMFPVPRFGKTTSNPVESMNSALKGFITKDVCNLIISINNYVMKIYNERRQKRFQSATVSHCIKSIQKNTFDGRQLSNESSSELIFLVDSKYIVNLATKSCDCREGYDMGIPCKHLCSVLRNKHIDPLSFVSTAFLSTTYYAQFSRNVLPLSATNLLRTSVSPPIARRARGRPRTRRVRAYF